MSQGKAWCFTLFHYDESSFRQIEGRLPDVSLFACQEEKCPSTGRLHIQGFVRFTVNKRLKSVKTWLGDSSAHLSLARGSSSDNLAYCSKSDSATGVKKNLSMGRLVSSCLPGAKK